MHVPNAQGGFRTVITEEITPDMIERAETVSRCLNMATCEKCGRRNTTVRAAFLKTDWFPQTTKLQKIRMLCDYCFPAMTRTRELL